MTSRSSGYGYECPTEYLENLCRVIPGVNVSGTVCIPRVRFVSTLENTTLEYLSHPTIGFQQKVPEFLTKGTQYLTPIMTSKALVRTPRPSFYALVQKYNVHVKLLD